MENMKLAWDFMQRALLYATQILARIGFLLVASVHQSLIFLYWKYAGIIKQINESKEPVNYALSAQVLPIKYRHALHLFPPTLSDFICCHERFVHPNYVLKDSVTFYFIDGDSAVFGECDEGVQIWRSSFDSFHNMATFKYARKLIVLPMGSLETLADEIGGLHPKIILLASTGRCGSTLLSQVFERTGQFVVFSEPEVLQNISDMYLHSYEDKISIHRQVKSIITLLCKPVESPSQVTGYVLKLTAQSIFARQLLLQVYPEMSSIFLYRDVRKVSQSFHRMSRCYPDYFPIACGGFLPSKFVLLILHKIGIRNKGLAFHCKSVLDYGALLWALSIKQYLIQRSSDDQLSCILYEDLVLHPQLVITAICKKCNVPEKLVTKGMEALKHASQVNSVMKNAKYAIAPQITPAREKRIREIMGKFGLGNLDFCVKLDGYLEF